MAESKISQEAIVNTAAIHIENGWYGDNYRVILYKENHLGFRIKTDAGKFTTLLKRYMRVDLPTPI